MTAHTPEEIAQAKAIASSVHAEVKALLAPLEVKFRRHSTSPAIRTIMWQAIAMEAIKRAKDAAR